MALSINPPPKDLSCECCHRPTEDLTPFPKAPNGQKLVKTYRDNCGCVGASWECYDCIGLTDKEYRKRKSEDEFTVMVKEKIDMIKEGGE